jgi:membrane protease YdiL (CAAX protease family)
VRRFLARFMPIDPRSPVHAVALSLVTAGTVMLLGELVAQGGRPPLLTLIQADPAAAKSGSSGPAEILYGLVWTLPAGLLLAGWPVVRTWRCALERLGLVRPTLRQVVFAVGLGLLIVPLSNYFDTAVGWVFHAAGWPRTDEKLFDQLLGPAVSRWGALAVGISAGLGEELIVRGALQPRLGLLLSTLFFTSLHAPQYGFDALLSVFLTGLLLGVVRMRANTTTSAIVHGVFDFTLLFAAALSKH